MDYEGLSEEKLEALRKKHHAERVIVELNGMHLAADFYLKTPDTWQIAQEVMFADANHVFVLQSEHAPADGR